jgi:hypothetical protein
MEPTKLSPDATAALLRDLCVIMGFCLPLDDDRRIQNDPPTDVEAFIDAVYQAEGTDYLTNKRCRPMMRQITEKHFSEWQSRQKIQD